MNEWNGMFTLAMHTITTNKIEEELQEGNSLQASFPPKKIFFARNGGAKMLLLAKDNNS